MDCLVDEEKKIYIDRLKTIEHDVGNSFFSDTKV